MTNYDNLRNLAIVTPKVTASSIVRTAIRLGLARDPLRNGRA